MNNYLAITLLVLWVCVLGLGLIVFALVRQVGVLSERVAPAGALMISKSLRTGDSAVEFSLKDLNSSDTLKIGTPQEQGKSTLLFFVSADCPVCKTLLPAFRAASKSEADWLDAVLATDGEQSEVERFIQQQDLREFPFVNSEALGATYGVSRLPFAVLISASGIIESSGLVNTREHFDSLFNAKDAKVASLQDYMRRENRRGVN